MSIKFEMYVDPERLWRWIIVAVQCLAGLVVYQGNDGFTSGCPA